MPNVSKIEEKKMRILAERRQRHLNNGVPEDKVDSLIAKEDYERLPAEQKITRLESMLVGATKSVGEDMAQLHKNQQILADSMDVNFLAFGMMMAKLGLTEEQQKEIVASAEQMFNNERQKQEEERSALIQEAHEKAIEASVDVPGESVVPEGATTFGG